MIIQFIFYGFAILVLVIVLARLFGPPIIMALFNHHERKQFEKQAELEYMEDCRAWEEEKFKLEEEESHYIALINNLEDIQRCVEYDIKHDIGNFETKLSKMVSLDKQIHAAKQKLDKIRDKLE